MDQREQGTGSGEQMSVPNPEPPDHAAHHRTVAREGSWAGMFNLMGAAIRYVNNIILTRMLGPAHYGLFALANTIVTVVAIPAGLGLPTSMVHFLASGSSAKQWPKVRWMVKAAFTGAVVASLAGACLVIATSRWISALFLLMKAKQLSPAQLAFQKENLPSALEILALALPFLVLYAVCAGGLQGLRQIRAKVFIERIAHPLLFSAMLLAGGYFFRSLPFVLVCFWVAALAVFLMSAFWFRRQLRSLPKAEGPLTSHWRELRAFSTPVMFMNLLGYFVLQSDILVMGAFRGLAEVGIYTIASRLAQGVSLPTDALGVSLAPSFSVLVGQGDTAGLKRLFHASTRWLFLLGCGVGLGLIFAGKLILHLFGKDFGAGFVVLCILATGQMFSASLGANGTLITMTGHPKVNLANSLCMGLGNLGLMVLLVPRYGAVGAATAAASSFMIVNIARALEIWFILKIGPWDRTILKPMIALLIAAIAGGGTFCAFGPWAAAPVGLGAFLLLWWTLGPEPEDLDMTRRAWGKVRRRPVEPR